MEYDESKLLKERVPRMHPLASPNNKSRGNAGSDREVRTGDRVVHTLDGRSGLLDECLHDGDALVTWDDGVFGVVKWCNLYPELLPPAPPPAPQPPEPDYQQIMDKLNLLQPGEALVYHTGFLAYQRNRNKKLTQLGQLALDLQEQKYVLLFQRKIGDCMFDYIAVGCRQRSTFDQNEIKQEIADAIA